MPTAATTEPGYSTFNTDKVLHDALTGNDALQIAKATEYLRKNFLQLFENTGMYKNKWYADDCLLIAIEQFLRYLNSDKFRLGERPLLSVLYVFFKRRVIDFEKKEFSKNKRNYLIQDPYKEDDILEKLQVESERKKIIGRAIGLLRTNCRNILQRKYFEELSIFQIADMMGVKVEGLYVETSRCKKELKSILIDKFKFPPHGLWI